MPARDTQHGTGTGLVITVASAVACVAIIAASAVVARKPPPRQDFLALAPKVRERPLGPDLRADEEEDAPAEEEPRPAELIARAEKLLADGSRDRAQIEGLLLAAVKARPGTEESIEAFKLLRGLYGKWRQEDAKLPGPGIERRAAEPVSFPRSTVPAAVSAGSEKVEIYSEDFEGGPGGWSGGTVRDSSAGGTVLRAAATPESPYHAGKGYRGGMSLQASLKARASFKYRTEGGLSRATAQFFLEDPSGAKENYYTDIPLSRGWREVDLPFERLASRGKALDLAGGFRIRTLSVYAGTPGEKGEGYIDAFGINRPAGAARAAPVPPAVAPRPPVTSPTPPTPGFVSLIGTDLSNWGRPSAGTWKLEHGAILGDCLNTVGYLYARRPFCDFTLKLKATALATSETDPHLKVRFRWIPEKGLYGCQAELCRDAYFYGNVVDAKNSERRYRPSSDLSLSVGRSVDVELVVIGESVTMRVNGKEVFTETTKITEPGEVGLGAHRSSILFERVEIKEH